MPSKIQLDENLWFLYICLQKSDYKAIDFNGVGEITRLKAPAARMRYTRLRRSIEGGTMIGTRGTPFAGTAEKISEAQKKRKRPSQPSRPKDEEDDEALVAAAAAANDGEDLGILETRSGSRFCRTHTTEEYLSDNLASDEDSEYDARRSLSSDDMRQTKVARVHTTPPPRQPSKTFTDPATTLATPESAQNTVGVFTLALHPHPSSNASPTPSRAPEFDITSHCPGTK